MISRRIIVVTALAAFAAPAAAQQPEKLKIAVGQRFAWDTSMFETAKNAGIFAKHGIDLEVLWTQGSGETIQAVIGGSVDLGSAAGTTGVMSAFAKGAPIRPISNSMTGADDLFWYVPATSPIKTMKDAAGKSIAYSTNGSSTHLAVLGFQRFFGVQMKLTPTGGPPATLTQTLSGQIDIGWSSPPIAVDKVQKGEIRIIARESDVPEFRNQTVRMNIGNLDFITKRAAALDKFRAAYAEAIEWMYSGDAPLEAYGKFTQTNVEMARTIRGNYFPQDNLRINRVSDINNAMKDAIELKFLAQPLTKAQLDELFQYYAK